MERSSPPTKLDQLQFELRKSNVFSSVHVKRLGYQMYFTTAYRRIQELVAANRCYRRIPTEEAIMRGLIKKGNKNLAWFEHK